VDEHASEIFKEGEIKSACAESLFFKIWLTERLGVDRVYWGRAPLKRNERNEKVKHRETVTVESQTSRNRIG
jgi:hypothetical protein